MKPLKDTIRILILEDSEDDTLLMIHEFKRNNYKPVYERVETTEDMRSALSRQEWDIVLADYTMPHMNAFDGLKILHENGCDIPCIVVSGTIGEDVAVECMRAGATDYIMKESLKRLVPAVERELNDARMRQEHRRVEEEISRHENERLFILHVSEICGRVGLDLDEICMEIVSLISHEWHCISNICARITLHDKIFRNDCDEEKVTWHLSSAIHINGEIAGTIEVGCIGNTIKQDYDLFLKNRQKVLDNVASRLSEAIEYKKAQIELKESEERFRHLIAGTADGIVVHSPEGKILMANDYVAKVSGYSKEELLSMSLDEYTGRPISRQEKIKWNELEVGDNVMFESARQRKDGSVYEVGVNLTKIIYSGQPALLASVRDITEHKMMEKEREEHTRTLINALKQAIQAIAVSLEMKDPYTAGHQQRVTKLASAIASAMALSEERINSVSMAASVHDIGKMYVPSEILSKPARLTDIEYSMVKLHAQAGYDVLKNVEFPWPIAQIVWQHHERMDGSGYPQGLSGDDILLEARILAVADVVESMASHRPYRPAIGIKQALDEVRQNRGTLFDPDVVEACLRLFTEKKYEL